MVERENKFERQLFREDSRYLEILGHTREYVQEKAEQHGISPIVAANILRNFSACSGPVDMSDEELLAKRREVREQAGYDEFLASPLTRTVSEILGHGSGVVSDPGEKGALFQYLTVAFGDIAAEEIEKLNSQEDA